jgi:hypothetical protein
MFYINLNKNNGLAMYMFGDVFHKLVWSPWKRRRHGDNLNRQKTGLRILKSCLHANVMITVLRDIILSYDSHLNNFWRDSCNNFW